MKIAQKRREKKHLVEDDGGILLLEGADKVCSEVNPSRAGK